MSTSRKTMRYAAGVSAAVLTASMALASTASGLSSQAGLGDSLRNAPSGGTSHQRPPLNASAVTTWNVTRGGAHQGHSGKAQAGQKGFCGTAFGKELPTPDGIISWNDNSGSGIDTGGAADIVCKTASWVTSLDAYGYGGDPTDTFHVTFYADSSTDGSSEADDAQVLCDYPALTGQAGGQYPAHVLTHLDLPGDGCIVPQGVSWVSIQSVNASTPWYWEMQNSSTGKSSPDFIDRHDAFGSGCTTFNNDRYLVDCLAYPYPDFMFQLYGTVGPLKNVTPKGASVKYGNAACPNQPYYLYSGGKQDNYAAPADFAYPRPDLVTFMGASPGGNVNYDVPVNNGRFGDTFNLQNTRSVCYAVIEFQAKGTGDYWQNDGLTFGHIGVGGSPFSVVGQVINPGGFAGVQSYALTPAALQTLSMQTGYNLDKTVDQSAFDVYLQDDTELDFFRMYVWYGPNCAQGGPYGGCH